MGGSTNKSTSSTSPGTSVTNTTNKLLGGIDAAWAKGPTPFNESLYAGLGGTTKSGLASMINSATPVANGANIGVQDPGYASIRKNLSNDVLTSTNGAFNNSGLFGSDNNQQQAAEGLGNALGSLDYGQYKDSLDRQTQAQSTLLSAGAIQDADKQAALQGRYDLSQRQGNAKTDLLARLSSILSGTAGNAGSTTTTSTPSTPWWQSALGAAIGFA